MLKIDKTVNDRELKLALEGELDSTTSAELDREVQNLDDVDSVLLDLEKLAYTSSAGLRVIIGLKRRLAGRPLKLVNIGLGVREVLDMTGLSALLGV